MRPPWLRSTRKAAPGQETTTGTSAPGQPRCSPLEAHGERSAQRATRRAAGRLNAGVFPLDPPTARCTLEPPFTPRLSELPPCRPLEHVPSRSSSSPRHHCCWRNPLRLEPRAPLSIPCRGERPTSPVPWRESPPTEEHKALEQERPSRPRGRRRSMRRTRRRTEASTNVRIVAPKSCLGRRARVVCRLPPINGSVITSFPKAKAVKGSPPTVRSCAANATSRNQTRRHEPTVQTPLHIHERRRG